jgi:hypothetical protein
VVITDKRQEARVCINQRFPNVGAAGCQVFNGYSFPRPVVGGDLDAGLGFAADEVCAIIKRNALKKLLLTQRPNLGCAVRAEKNLQAVVSWCAQRTLQTLHT